ncbi:MAG: hydrogenase maturation protease [Phycisphaerae bacterium]|nr:hydrogenase maturation protease [Phycisphaerae bacterium]
MPPAVCILGCGRWSMGDDQAGLRVAELIADHALPQADVRLSESPGTDLADGSFASADLLVLIDAAPADNAHPSGSFLRLMYPRDAQRLRRKTSGDSHSIGIAQGLELAQTLQALPKRIWIYVVFGEQFDRSLDMSTSVSRAITPLAERISRDVDELNNQPHP